MHHKKNASYLKNIKNAWSGKRHMKIIGKGERKKKSENTIKVNSDIKRQNFCFLYMEKLIFSLKSSFWNT